MNDYYQKLFYYLSIYIKMQNDQYSKALECLDRVISKIKPQTSSRMKSAIVALFSNTALEQHLRYSSKITLVHLDFDRQIKTALLRFYDIDTLCILLQVQLYYGFLQSYRQVQKVPNLWVFDLWEDGNIGMQFRNELEAKLFHIKLEQMAPKREDLKQLSRKQIQQQLKKKKENSFFGKLKNKLFTKQQTKRQSIVIQVKKSKAVRFDKNGGFIVQNISPEWEEILKQSGLKVSDMSNPEISQLVLQQTLLHETKKAAEIDPTILQSSGYQTIKQLQFEQQSQAKESLDRQRQLKKNIHQYQHQSKKQTQPFPNSNLIPSIPPLDLLIPPMNFLPPPPPTPILSPNINSRNSINPKNRASMKRENLLEQIRNNKVKLKPVKANQQTIEIDASSMNKQERKDLAQQIRFKLQQRKAALNRRHSSDEED